MKKYLLSAWMLAFSFHLCHTQVPSDALRTTFQDGEFFLARENYLDALVEFQQVYKRGFDNANVNYRMGVCYLNIPGQKQKAIPHLEKAVQDVTYNYTEGLLREKKASIDAFLYLGNAYRIDNQIEKAVIAYNQFKKLLREGAGKELTEEENIYLNYANQQINACRRAQEAMKNPVAIEKNNLGETINSSSSNYRAVMSGDEQSMVYMNELPFYHAVYYSVKENGQWSKPKNLTPEIQSDGDQLVSFLSYDGTQLILSREDVFDSELYISNLQDDGTWSASQPLNRNINTKYWESHGSLSTNGDTLYFASNRRESHGGMDIFFSVKDEKGQWGKPENIGKVINTGLNEEYPFLTRDGKRLFFCSQGHNSIGGYDIFYSEKDEQGNWSEPVNMGFPFNTTDDDIFYYPIDNGDCGLVALIEQDGYGKEDIYELCRLPEDVMKEAIAEQVEMDREEEIDQQERSDSVQLALEQEEKPEQRMEQRPEQDTLPAEKDRPTQEEKPRVEEFTVRPIYFAFDYHGLSMDAKNELDRIVDLMKRKEKLHLKLFGYTDAIGPDAYNMILSKNRANAAKAYLVREGISEDRIATYAQGEANPVEPNTNPDGSDNLSGRRKNRRVEFEFAASKAANVRIIQQQ